MPKHVTILLFLFSVHFCALAKDWRPGPSQKKIDSLKRVLPFLKDSTRIDCLNELGEAYHWFEPRNNYGSMIDSATMYVLQALKEAEKINYIQGKAMAYQNLGGIEWVSGRDFINMEKYFTLSLALFLKTPNENEIAWTWTGLGNAKWFLSKFPEAFDAFEEAISIYKKNNDTGNLVGIYNSMSVAALEWGHYEKALQCAFKFQELTGSENGILGELYFMIGDYDTALEYYRKMHKGGRVWEQKDRLLGSTFFHNKQYDSANYYYQLFLSWVKTEGLDWAKTKWGGTLSKFYAALGEVYFDLKHYDTALVYLNNALNMHTKSNDRNQVMLVLLAVSKTYFEKGDYGRAFKTSQQLLYMANETGTRQFSRDVHFLLYKLFEANHRQDSAYHHLQQFTVLKDSIDLVLSAQKLAFYKIRSEREQAKSRMNILNEEKKMQQQQLKQTALQKKFLTGGIAALLILGTVLFRNILLKRKNEKNLRELAETQLKIQKLEIESKQAGLQQQATELEMQALRAQMNPHFIFNCLNAINGFILVNESEAAADYLTKFSRLIRLVLNNSQKQFIPLEEELETLGLYLHMESLRFKHNFHYRVNCDDTVDTSTVLIPPILIQPFAENAIWHGLMNKEGARTLLINLHVENNMLYCTITDNGVGRKKAALLKSKSVVKNKSMGVQITKDRIALLNPDLNDECFFEITDLEDEWGNAAGTKVSLKIKINEIQPGTFQRSLF